MSAVTVGISAVAATSVTTGTGTSPCDPSNTCAAAITSMNVLWMSCENDGHNAAAMKLMQE